MERKGKKEGKIFDTKEDGKSFMIYRDLRDFFLFSISNSISPWFRFSSLGIFSKGSVTEGRQRSLSV